MLVPAGIAVASTVGKGFVGQYGFVLTRTRRGLAVRAGLLDVRSQSIPVDRVQGVVVLEPLVWRWFGWCEVQVTVAGVERRGDDDSNLTSTLVPVIAGDAGARLAIDALGGRDPGGVMLRQVPAAARMLDPVGWRIEALGVGPDLFVTRRGVLTRRTDMTPRHKLQSCALRQGPLQRRLGLATLHAHLPTGPVDPEGRHREPAEAWTLRCRSRRRTETDVAAPPQMVWTERTGTSVSPPGCATYADGAQPALSPPPVPLGLERKVQCMTSSSSQAARFRVGVIGAGRVGAVLAAALRAAGHEVVAASGSSGATRMRLTRCCRTWARNLPSRSHGPPSCCCSPSPTTLSATSWNTWPRRVPAPRTGRRAHQRPARHRVLAPAAELGALTIALHPAMTFTGTDLDLERLPGCVLGLTAGPRGRVVGEQLAADLGAQVVHVDEEQRTRYHAALAHGANHLATLVVQSVDLLRAAGSSDPAADLRPLLQAALDNGLAYGDAALTGPVVRGDVRTVAAHLDALRMAEPGTRAAYRAMAAATAHRARADGRLSSERAEAIDELLGGDRASA